MFRDKEMNAATIGTTNPCVYVTSALVKYLSSEQIASVLAHECGHIACKHYLYHSIVANVINKLSGSPLGDMSPFRRFVTPGLVNAFLFWDRCSELSADRAAVLCDGKPETMVDSLLRIHGYVNINREEFIKQAVDLHSFVNDTKGNKAIEQMIVSGESHPRLATRVYECCEWSKTDSFKSILNGTYRQIMKEQSDTDEEEIIAAEVECKAEPKNIPANASAQATQSQIDAALAGVNKQLERYTFDGCKADYALAISSGILAGLIDSVFVGELSLQKANQWGNEQAEKIVLKVAKNLGCKKTTLSDAVEFLEDRFPIAADKATNTFGGGLNHHLRDFSHHPTLFGLICSIITQFTKKVYGTDKKGKFIAFELGDNGLELIGKNFPEKITFGVINWIFHLVSDMAGSSSSVKNGSLGTGLPGPIVSLLKGISVLPFFKSQNKNGPKELSVYISKLFHGTLLGVKDENGKPIKFDLRTEMGLKVQLEKQKVPIVINECIVRAFCFLKRLTKELSRDDIQGWRDLTKVNWKSVLPVHNRTLDRMLMISSMTFTIADTADAAVHAVIESHGNWLLFSGVFVSRFNYIGAGRAAIAIVKEVSNERKEAQLIHEKLILTGAKTADVLEKFESYRVALEERVSDYLAEDIEEFLNGFDYMEQGVESGDSNLVIKGNVVIQRVLGREPQFTNQEEFDDLMDSDEALIL